MRWIWTELETSEAWRGLTVVVIRLCSVRAGEDAAEPRDRVDVYKVFVARERGGVSGNLLEAHENRSEAERTIGQGVGDFDVEREAAV